MSVLQIRCTHCGSLHGIDTVTPDMLTVFPDATNGTMSLFVCGECITTTVAHPPADVTITPPAAVYG